RQHLGQAARLVLRLDEQDLRDSHVFPGLTRMERAWPPELRGLLRYHMRPLRQPDGGRIPRSDKDLAREAPWESVVKALNPMDLYDVRGLLSEEEQLVQDTTARFVDEKV